MTQLTSGKVTPWLVLLLALLFTLPSYAQLLPDYQIKRQGAKTSMPENIQTFISSGQLEESEEINGYYYKLIQFYFLPDKTVKQALEDEGIRLLSYIPNNVYTAAIPTQTAPETLEALGIRSIESIGSDWKLSPRLQFEDYGDWAVNREDIQLLLTFFPDQNMADVISYCESDGIRVEQHNGRNNVLQVLAPISDIKRLAKLPYVSYLDQIPEPGEPEDVNGKGIHRSTAIDTRFDGGRKYTGEGVGVQTRDDGAVGPHIDFQGRLINVDPQGGGTHGDGVSGIFAGAGNLDPYMRGMAAGADLYVTDYASNFLDTTLGLHLNEGVLVTNSSYSNGCNAGYTAITQIVDQQMYENLTYMHVFSAGNSGTGDCDYGAGSGWGNITGGHKQGKNVLATANLETDYDLRNSSSRGPAHDGRIKPDIAANGHNQQSTNPENIYISFSGTSAAAPGIAGVTAQLHQAYRENNNGETAEGALLKAIMLNTANDMGNPGPDFLYGWGHVNALKAVKAIEEERYFFGVVDQTETNQHDFQIPPGTRQAKIMVYWHDFPAEAEVDLALVNDLDATITDAAGGIHLPYVLDNFPDPSILSLPATQGEDHLNNMEQIVLQDPEEGIYTLDVNGFNVAMGPVKYWVVLEYLTDELEMIHPYGGEGFAPGQTIRIHWDALPNGSPYTMDYSIDNGQSWTSIINNIAQNARYWDWVVPDVVTSEALVRVSRDGNSDTSEANFSIIGTPQNLEITQACPDYIRMEWEAVNGATHYDLFSLGERYMDSVATTDQTFYDFPTEDFNPTLDYWFSVRAVVPDEAVRGERAIAIPYNDGLLNCVQAVDLSISTLDNPNQSFYTVCDFNEFEIAITGFNDGMSTESDIEVGYNFNGEVFTEALGITLEPGEEYNHTFSQAPTIDASGLFQLTAWVSATDDSANFNDTTYFEVEVIYYPGAGEALEIIEDFEEPDLAPYWQIINEDQAATWNPRDSVIGITGDFTRVYWINNYSYNAFGQKDIIVTVPIDLSDTDLTEPMLFFDISYAPYPSDQYVDTLQVEVYSDCGAELAGIPYQKWEGELETSDPSFAGHAPQFGSDWRTEMVDLSPYLGTTIILQFVNKNGWGNNLYIDNINVKEAVAGPSAFFELASTTICAESIVIFEDDSEGMDLEHMWTFEPGATPSTAMGPGPHEVIFSDPGIASATLDVSNGNGTDSYSLDLDIQALATADFGLLSDELTVEFVNLSTNATSYQWDFGDGLGSSIDFEPVYTYEASGTYTVVLTATNDCGEVSYELDITVEVIDNTSEQWTESNFSLSPNPTTNNVYIRFEETIANDLQVEVLDITGKLLVQERIGAGSDVHQIDLAGLASGMYFVRLSNGQTKISRKLIKE